jgi:hypothetical protein
MPRCLRPYVQLCHQALMTRIESILVPENTAGGAIIPEQQQEYPNQGALKTRDQLKNYPEDNTADPPSSLSF